ncbi:AI-2E family transporter [Mucilaginibacter segetis]|uniref:AI-2E family transporter n=1 Tax=Mucilaginibacter segetis TaxID=2793071 RepID=A0A934PRD6_9SPHI|nr:AI-2E family transporter [Mucilaginibacter segetis]MBK0378719.1 AI-2E family transporter [Mucilaginibacter segetis]
MNKIDSLLPRSVQILLLLFLVFSGLYFSAGFLVPIALAGIMAMLFLPFSRWMEKKGVGRTVAAVICILTLVLAIAVFLFLISWRISNLQANFDQIEQQFNKYLLQVQEYINNSLGVSKEQQDQMLKKNGSSGASNAASYMAGFAAALLSSLTTGILMLIYIFLFISSRSHFKKFLLKLVKPENKANTMEIVAQTTEVAQNYVSGLAKMIFCLWIMYSIGFSIVGVNNAIFFAILCGTLEIIPFVGNITGTALTVLMALAQGGGGGMVLSVLVTYGLVQFIQSYILQPLVVGKDVNVNPLFTIMVLVLGEAVWGIGGMVLSIPLLGMCKIVFDHIEPLKPYGYLIGNGDKSNDDKPMTEKIKSWFKH